MKPIHFKGISIQKTRKGRNKRHPENWLVVRGGDVFEYRDLASAILNALRFAYGDGVIDTTEKVRKVLGPLDHWDY